MNRDYTIRYQSTDDGIIGTWTAFATFDTFDDKSLQLAEEYRSFYKDDLNFKVIKITKHPTSVGARYIDWELLDRMNAVREICELGHKVRANIKIRNRQPLRNAYVILSDKTIQDYMLYIDCKNDEYNNIIKKELNVFNVEFVCDTDKYFNYNIKPNFRVLGKKGFGKQAQQLKDLFNKMSFDDKAKFIEKIKTDAIELLNISLTSEDVEVEFVAKENFAAATGKLGAIVLDTLLDNELLEYGFIADFKSEIQNIRKEAKLSLTDKILLEIVCSDKCNIVIDKFQFKLKQELLTNQIKFLQLKENWNVSGKIVADISAKAHKLIIDKELLFVYVYKVKDI